MIETTEDEDQLLKLRRAKKMERKALEEYIADHDKFMREIRRRRDIVKQVTSK